jgi:hypothetical protein
VAKQLVNGGMSRRGAAKALGVSHQTINDDLGGKKVAKNGKKVATPPEEMPTAEEADETLSRYRHRPEDAISATCGNFFGRRPVLYGRAGGSGIARTFFGRPAVILSGYRPGRGRTWMRKTVNGATSRDFRVNGAPGAREHPSSHAKYAMRSGLPLIGAWGRRNAALPDCAAAHGSNGFFGRGG